MPRPLRYLTKRIRTVSRFVSNMLGISSATNAQQSNQTDNDEDKVNQIIRQILAKIGVQIDDDDAAFSTCYMKTKTDMVIFERLAGLTNRMRDPKTGISRRTGLRGTKSYPQVFAGIDLIWWIMKNVNVDRDEAMYLANVLSTYGFLFSIDRHDLKVKNNPGFYRFQNSEYWLDGTANDSDQAYAVYLYKRTIDGEYYEELDEYEIIHFGKLNNKFSKHWMYIKAQGIAEINLLKKQQSCERQIKNSEDRAFWALRRPQPGAQTVKQFDYEKILEYDKLLE